jgi:hypothetical protein
MDQLRGKYGDKSVGRGLMVDAPDRAQNTNGPPESGVPASKARLQDKDDPVLTDDEDGQMIRKR